MFFAFPNDPCGLRHISILAWKRIIQIFFSDPALIAFTTPEDIPKFALARFAELATAITVKVRLFKRTHALDDPDHPFLLRVNSYLAPFASMNH
jgi:hypothetical protein